jgi:hypothetical protein
MVTATIHAGPLNTRFNLADECGLCPECGATMKEIDRLKENSWTFIWLVCTRADCDGQWLQRKVCQESEQSDS